MTVTVTQEELNILNLNGISEDAIGNNINYMRMSGYDDDYIRQEISNTIEVLRPITKTGASDTKNIQEWTAKGGITPSEFAKREADSLLGKVGSFVKEIADDWKPKEENVTSGKEFEWTGDYTNVVDTEKELYEKEAPVFNQKILERNKRVNEGTASLWERAEAWTERMFGVPVIKPETYEGRQKQKEEAIKNIHKEWGEPIESEAPIDKSGKIGFGEALGDSFKNATYMPFLSGLVEGIENQVIRSIANKVIGGETITKKEYELLNNYVEGIKEKNVRGYTIGGVIGDNILQSLIRFGGEMALGGLVFESLGLASKAAEGASTLQKVGVGLKNAGKFGLLNVLIQPTENYSNYQQRRIDDSFRLTEDGKVILREAQEKPATAVLKSLFTTFLMFSTESMGEVMGLGVKGAANLAQNTIGKPLFNALMKNKNLTKFVEKAIPELSKRYEQLNNLPIKSKNLDWLKSKVKYDGFLEEIGEEVLEDVLNVTLEIDSERTLENYKKAIFKSPDEWLILGGMIALQGQTLSIASHMLGTHMMKNGASEAEVKTTLQNLGEEGTVEQLSKLVENGEIPVDDYNSYENRRKRAVDSMAEKLGKTYKDKDYSKYASEIAVDMAEHISDVVQHLDLEEAIEKEVNPQFNSYADSKVAYKNADINDFYNIGKENVQDDTALIDNRIDEIYKEIDSLNSRDKEYEAKLFNEAELLKKLRNNTLDESEVEQAQKLMSGLKNTVYNQSAQYAGADENNYEDAAKEWAEKGTDSKYFRNWTDEAPLVTSDEALSYDFKTGEKVAVEGHHGTKRADRVGEVFRPERATSAAMAMFTSNREVANGYAEGKNDTSVFYEDTSYENYYKYILDGQKIKLSDVWNKLTYAQKSNIAEKAPHVTFDEEMENIIYDENRNNGTGNYQQYLKERRGNVLHALIDEWLNSGNLYNQEEKFSEVLKLAGLKENEFEYDNPYAEHPAVYDVYISFKNPIITNNIPKKVLTKLNKEAKKQPIPKQSIGADMWDKNTRNPIVWIDRLNEDYAKGENSFVWTSIPDWVTDVLKSFGYDGIIDVGGKSGGEIHKVYIPFESTQIKSVDNRGTFDSNNPNIYYQRKKYDNPDQLKFDFDSLMTQQAKQQEFIFQPESVSGQNVQQEIKKEYKEADIKQEKIDKANNGDIVDTGDSLLGNLKKDKKQYSWAELESMNELLRKKYLSKSYIYSLPTADELRKEGLSDRTIAYVYLVHSKINAKPSKYYDDKLEYQKIYFDGVHEVMQKTIDFAKKNNDLIANYNKDSGRNKELFDAIFPDYENKKPYNVFSAYPDLNRKALIVGGNKLVDVFQLGYSTENDITKALALVDKEKTNKTKTKDSNLTGWETKFIVGESYRGWFVADKKSGMIITERDLPSEAIAKEVAQKIYDYIKEQEFSFTANYETLRDYIPRRENNQNVKPEALIEVFGFRGINFGNWTKQSERQDFINLAYDSLYDLAELLKLPPRALSLDGKLGLAFGAQGRSGSAGHFIPEYNEINLTRKYGAGSLAHEWWHALDYYFGDFALGKDFSGESALGSVKQGLLRTEIFDALKNLMEQIKYAPLSEEEVEKRAKLIEEGARENIEYYAKDIKNSFAKSKNADKIAALIDDIVKNADKIDISTTEARVDYDNKFMSLLEEKRQTWTNIGKMSSLIYACKKLQQVKEIAAAQKSYTKFYNDARELNRYEKGHGKTYWTKNTELGARAFASYILDKTAKQNFKNNFLVRNENGEMSYNLESIGKKLAALKEGEKLTIDENDKLYYYPSDSGERERIYAAFDNLFNNIKYQKTDRGYRLYQSAFQGSPSDFDIPSLDYIGTGEGAQAHGWGLYYAENKKIADTRYRMALIADEGVKVNNKTYIKKNTNYVEKETEEYSGEELEDAIRYFVETGNKKDAINLAKRIGKGYLENNNEGMAKYYDRVANILEKNNFEFVNKGQLYKVDIPENDVLLDEDKLLGDMVLEKGLVDNLLKWADDNQLYYEIHLSKTGEEIYWAISKKLGSDKAASELLNNLGFKGITYDGRQDGRCYVIFDDKAIKILKKYYQDSEDSDDIFNEIANGSGSSDDTLNDVQGNLFFDKGKSDNFINTLNKRGAYIPVEKIIELYKNADESTFLHEMAHMYLDILTGLDKRYGADNPELRAEMQEIRKWLKNDGGEFTYEQHEKFARGFEAYIRSGYAKSNRLKQAFEYFKNFLMKIYDSLKALDIDEKEMPQIVNLFDRLMSTERERIKTTVFDKVSEIDNQIEKIKENEQKEFDEMNKIWESSVKRIADNAKAREYLALADKMTARETKEVREYKQRYKNATLEILEAATGKPRTWIANSRNWEKLQELLDKVDDKITVKTGFSPSWAEFYYDSGVSYENDETDGDYNLAEQAFNVLTENRYDNVFDENYKYEDINKYLEKFDYLAAKVKSEKYENKQAALQALEMFYNDSNNMPSMPDDIMRTVGERILKIQEDTYDDIRENYNRKSSLSGTIQLQAYITQKLDKLKVYNPETRYRMRIDKSHRLYRYIKNVRSVNSAKKEIKRINDYIIEDMKNNQRSLLSKEIQKQIKINSRAIKVGSMKKGRFDWATNTVFSELVELNKLHRKDAEAQLGALLKIQDITKGAERNSFDEKSVAEFDKTNDFQANLKNKFLQYKASRLQELDVTHTISVLQDILELKEKGRQAKTKEEFLKKTQKWNVKNNLLELLEVTKLSGLSRFGANWVAGVGKVGQFSEGVLANWESMLNALFNKQTAEKYSLLYDESRMAAYAREHTLDFYNRAFKIYGFREPNSWDRFLDFDYMQPLIKLMQEYDNEKDTFKQRVFSTNNPEQFAEVNIEISRAQMITMYAWSLNDKLEQRLMTQFGVEQIMDMFEHRLSEQDRQLAWALVDTCETMREDINEVFIRTTGLSLPKVENYFPSKAERVQSDIDLMHDFYEKSSSPSFTKDRKVCNRIPMKPMSPMEILIPHINKTARYVVMSEKVNYLNQIFKDTAIKPKMQEIWGSNNGAKIYQVMINKLAACTFTNYARGVNLVAPWLDNVSRNYITSSIGFSPKVMIGQLLSVVNYAENMPSLEWTAGFAATMTHPVESFKYMLDNCDYLKARLAGNSQNEIVTILTHEKDKLRTLRNFMTSNTKWGDMIAIALGGKPYVDYLMKQGMTKEEAFKKFTEDTLRAQQAGTTSSISDWQTKQAQNCLTRMFFAFRNTSIQYERKFVDTVIQTVRGDISKGEGIKKILIYKVFNPFMFTSFLQNLSVLALLSAIFRGDDSDKAAGNFLKNIIESLILSGLNSYGFAAFIASSVIESIIALNDDEYKHFEKDVPVLTDIDKQARKLLKGDLELGDYIDALAMFTEITTGTPATKIKNTVEGVGDVIQGNIGVGLTRMVGYGKYTATKAITGEAPEKKKKTTRKTISRRRAGSSRKRR